MALPDGASSIWVQVMRLAALDANGFVDPGAATYVTDKAIKLDVHPRQRGRRRAQRQGRQRLARRVREEGRHSQVGHGLTGARRP